MTSFFAVVKPPSAPPIALPSVPVKMSILSITPFTSAEPRPVLPRKPVAWHSSMCTSAPYFCASAVISSSGAMKPSIENTPSEVTMIVRAPSALACWSCFSRSAIRVEARGVQDRVLRAEEGRDRLLELLVQVLRAADEAHAGHAEAVRIQRVLGRRDHVGMVGQAQVVVRAEVQHRAAVGERDLGRLRAGDDAFGLEQPGFADFVEGFGVSRRQAHGVSSSSAQPCRPCPIPSARSLPGTNRSATGA